MNNNTISYTSNSMRDCVRMCRWLIKVKIKLLFIRYTYTLAFGCDFFLFSMNLDDTYCALLLIIFYVHTRFLLLLFCHLQIGNFIFRMCWLSSLSIIFFCCKKNKLSFFLIFVFSDTGQCSKMTKVVPSSFS